MQVIGTGSSDTSAAPGPWLGGLGGDAAVPALREVAPRRLRFGRFVLRMPEHCLRRDGVVVEIGSRAFDLLLMMADSGGALLTKNDILDRVWPNVIVEENNLQVQVSQIRRILGPDRDWIVTVPGRGYRFIAPVTQEPLGGAAPVAARRHCGAVPLSLLVLPFVARGNDPAQEWFTAGITDSLLTDLARAMPNSRLLTHSAAQAGEHAREPREIGCEQGVRYVLEGSVLFTEDRVRVNAQLTACETGAALWAERFDRPRHDMLLLQDEIVVRLSRTTATEMVAAEARRVQEVAPEQLTAADCVLRGHALAHGGSLTAEKVRAARAMYARALHRDAANADALIALAQLCAAEIVYGFVESGPTVCDDAGRESRLSEGEALLARGLCHCPEHSQAPRARAILLRARGAFPEAMATTSAVLARDPVDLIAHREMGLNLLYLGRTQDALGWFRRADTLAPVDPIRWTWLQGLARGLMQLERDEEAVSVLRQAVENNRFHAPLHALLAAALALSGQPAQAAAEMALFRAAAPDVPVSVLARRSAVPCVAADPEYLRRNARIAEGMMRAGGD
jgi:TolB-like protein/DNA-binding winged helix-turn-helix (wHTH) protein/tetratricopeptide (TPR) repeat protein